jgi:hypothetical protein
VHRLLRPRNETGIALVSVVMIAMVVALMTVVAMAVTVHSLDQTKVNRRRVQATPAAEAGIDLAVNQLSTSAYSGMPCTLSGSLSTQPGQASYSVTLSYYSTFPISGSPMTCPLSSAPAAVEVVSTGTTTNATYGRPRMEALIQLTPVPSTGLTKAIFSDQIFWPQNATTVLGNSGNDANVYSNTDVKCAGTLTVNGSIYAQGVVGGTAPDGASARNCRTLVDTHAKGSVDVSGTFTVGHDVISSGSSITLGSGVTVTHDAKAATTNTGGTVNGSRLSSQSGIADPPTESLPTVTYSATNWSGWDVRDEGTSCANAQADINSMASATQKRLVRVTGSCIVQLPNGGSSSQLKLAQDLAVVADGGIKNTGETWMGSTNSTRHKVYLIVPNAAVTTASPCNYSLSVPDSTGAHDIDFKGEFYDLSGALDFFFFSPCKVLVENATHSLSGQMYAKEIMFKNNTSLSYVPFTVPGVTTTSSGRFTTQIVYKREIGSG